MISCSTIKKKVQQYQIYALKKKKKTKKRDCIKSYLMNLMTTRRIIISVESSVTILLQNFNKHVLFIVGIFILTSGLPWSNFDHN